MQMTRNEMVRRFFEATGQTIPPRPIIPAAEIITRRIDMLQEELDELRLACDRQDKAAIADALTDLDYVLIGAFFDFGLYDVKDEAFALVHAANMAKIPPDGRIRRRVDGKILKPPGWSPPDLAPLLAAYEQPTHVRPHQGEMKLQPPTGEGE